MTETIQSHRYNPCKGCPDRYIACSDHCQKPEFLKWKDEQALIRKNRKAYHSSSWQHPESTQKTKFGPRTRKN